MPAPTEITPNQLARLIGTPECPVIIDVCIDEDFNMDPRVIPGAFRHPFNTIETLAPTLQGQKVIVACHKGLKLSQGSAALLRHHGIDCETLAGGVVAWAEANLPMVHVGKVPFQQDGTTLWVTRQRPKIDRIACPWLIRRFIDPNAKFMFVASSQVLNVAEKFGATPFDVEECHWTHRGDDCTFDMMVKQFGLSTEPLDTLSTIVRGADTNRNELAPQSAGLMAVSLGLSRMYRDDLAQLDAGLLIYDALYRWARDATNETHDWPATGSKG